MSIMEYLAPELSSPELDSSLEERRSTVSPTNSGGEEVESPPRATRVHSHKIRVTLDGKQIEFEKPPHSYIALISKAILSSPQKKMLLGDIYQYIMDNYPYYSYLGDKSWRNSIRHNLSLNECFIKNGRADNGKGNFWAIHSACFEDFSKGDFRRRQARRRARRSQMPANQLPVNQLPVTYAYNMGYVPMTQMPVSMGFSRQYHHHHHHPYAAAAAAAASAPTYIPSSRRHYVQQQYHAQQQLYHQASNAAYAHAAATAAAAAVMTSPGSPSPVSSVMTTPQIHPSWLGASGIQALREALSGIAPVHQSQS